MTSAGGGTAAAHGFLYQYLRTLESLLDVAESSLPGDWQVVVDDPVADVVDLALACDGRVVEATQVKATVDPVTGRSMGLPEAVRLLLSLLDAGDTGRAVVATNRRPTEACRRLAEALAGGAGRQQVAALCDPADVQVLTDRGWWDRFLQSRVVLDPRSADAVRDDLVRRLVRYRRGRERAAGPRSSDVLVNHLLTEVFRRGADPRRSSLAVVDFRELLETPDLTLARAAGGIDWGVPVGPLPRRPDVDRPEERGRLTAVLGNELLDRVPRYAVVSGLSGIGKSSLVAAHAHALARTYDRVVWLGARSRPALEAAVAAALPELDDQGGESPPPVPPSDPERLRRRLTDLLARTPATWLLVFDDVVDREVVESWLPAVGSGHVVLTTTDATAFPQLPAVRLGSMDDDQAEELLARRVGIPRATMSGTERSACVAVCRTMENWPLALELAGAWLAASGRGLDLSDQYLARLRELTLGEEALRPVGYPSSLLAAVLLGFDRVRSGPGGELALLLLYVLSFLPLASANLVLALTVAADLQAVLAGSAVRIELETALDRAVAGLRRASLVDREPTLPPAGRQPWPVAAVNEVVAEIARGVLEPAPDAPRTVLVRGQARAAQWTSRLLTEKHLEGLKALRPDAEALLDQAEQRGELTVVGLGLMGDLASGYLMQGDAVSAASLLHRERAHLAEVRGRPHMRFYTGVYLARCHVDLDDDPTTSLDLAEEAIAVVAAEEESAPGATAAWTPAVTTLRDVLRVLASVRGSARAAELLDALDQVAGGSELPPGPVEEVEWRLREQDWPGALEAYARARGTQLSDVDRFLLECRRLEALAGAEDWPAFHELLDVLVAGPRGRDPEDQTLPGVCLQIGTAASLLLSRQAAGVDPDRLAVVEAATGVARRSERWLPPYERFQLLLLEAVVTAASASPEQGRAALAAARAARRPAPATVIDDRVGTALLEALCESLVRWRELLGAGPVAAVLSIGVGTVPFGPGVEAPALVLGLGTTDAERVRQALGGRVVIGRWSTAGLSVFLTLHAGLEPGGRSPLAALEVRAGEAVELLDRRLADGGFLFGVLLEHTRPDQPVTVAGLAPPPGDGSFLARTWEHITGATDPSAAPGAAGP